MKAKVFIVDDHYMVIEGIRSLLQNESGIEWTGHATNAESCLAFLQRQQPDVILMDINLPDKSGIELCRDVKTKYPAIRILGLSTFNQRSYIEKMMENGASGYLLKNAGREELLKGIEMAMQRKFYMSHEAALSLRSTDSQTLPILTRREKEILELIAAGLTNQEIADKLFISYTTVDTHRKNLLQKFEAKNVAVLINLATKNGFL
ncbi:MAG TPA: response regulator transcription factor [Draconibacterium sp.]|jgi:DNA-binding NarL/FixJ family response regulator|nr:response regulator transcription factor [Draconibacterium sp.]